MTAPNQIARLAPSDPRAGTGQSPARLLQLSGGAPDASSGQAPYDRRVSHALDRWELAQAALVMAFQGLRRESADCPNARHLPRLLRVVWAFAETVNNIRSLEDGAGI